MSKVKETEKEMHCYYRMKKKNGLYVGERIRSDGLNVLDVKESEENLFEIIHENLSASVRNDLAMGDSDDRPF